jgi:glycosyltransferase involved in cell wall biosynthesis
MSYATAGSRTPRAQHAPRIVDIINLSSSADTLLRERVLALRARGIDNHIVCMPGPYVQPLRELGIPIGIAHFPRGYNPVKFLWSLLETVAYLKRVKADLVHTHCSVPGVIGRLAARLAGVPVIMHTVHGFHFHDAGRGFSHALAIAVERFVGRFTNVMLSQNRADIEQAVRHRIVPRERLFYIGNGIDVDRFPVAPACVDEQRTPVITCVARFEPVKNHGMLIEAARILKEHGTAFELWLVGGGSGRALWEERCAEWGLANHVRFLGYRDDIPELLAASDLGTLTSLKEGIPRAALEAMVVGLPVVATRVNGTREVVRDGDTGFLVEVGDVAGLANALERLLLNPELRARMGERGRRVVLAEYDEADIVNNLERIYREVLSRRGISTRTAMSQEVSA